MSGVKYSYKTSTGATSYTFQPNYYGTGLAARALYMRSGYGPALTLANNIDEYWINDPEICAGYCLSAFSGIRRGEGSSVRRGQSYKSQYDLVLGSLSSCLEPVSATIAANQELCRCRYAGYGQP